MGASASSNSARLVKQPLSVGEFRSLGGPSDYYAIPEVPEKRKVTDFKFTVTFAIFLGILVPFLIYTFVYTDLNRLFRGVDKCGNICGKNNSHVQGIDCSGQSKVDLPLLKYTETNRGEDYYKIRDFECVESCDDSTYAIILNRCFPKNSNDEEAAEQWAEVVADINRSAGYIVALCFIGLGLAIGMLVLFRYFVAVVVWVILIGSITGFIILTIVLWYLYKNSDGPNAGLQYCAILFTVVSVGLIIILICLFKRVKLVIRLFKESIKVIFGIPLILLEPVLTFLAATILFMVFAFFLTVFSTAGILQHVSTNEYDYVPNGVMLFTVVYHCIICLWMFQFIIGCQHMVISGAVSAYYFARDKSSLVSPIYTSFYNLVRYHLGTVAFGSLLITLIALLKAILRSLANNKLAKVLIDCCLGAVEDFLKYLSKNAYIQTAMHGQPFYKSGKRAVRLLAANFLSAVAVNSVGDFVLNMAKLLIVVCTVGIGILMQDSSIKHFWAAIFISAIVTAIIADCFFAVFETTVDTLFLCFCEDNCLNDGMERPYYMSTNLMQYMEDAKKLVKDKERQ